MTRSIVDEEVQEIIYNIFEDRPDGIHKLEVYPKLKCVMFEVYSINTHELSLLWDMFGDMNIRMTADIKTAMIRVLIQEKSHNITTVHTATAT